MLFLLLYYYQHYSWQTNIKLGKSMPILKYLHISINYYFCFFPINSFVEFHIVSIPMEDYCLTMCISSMMLLSYVARIQLDQVHRHQIALNVRWFHRYQAFDSHLTEDEQPDEQEQPNREKKNTIGIFYCSFYTLEASFTKENWLSIVKYPPRLTPYRPPTSFPPCQTSTECA